MRDGKCGTTGFLAGQVRAVVSSVAGYTSVYAVGYGAAVYTSSRTTPRAAQADEEAKVIRAGRKSPKRMLRPI